MTAALPAAVSVEMWPIGRLKPRATNSRTHTPQQIDQIVASIREFGWTNPILAGSDDDVIAGHARLQAASKMGLKEVPVIALGHLTDDQKRALVIADNQLALNAGWDNQLLAAELELLKAADFNLELLGFNESALAELLAEKTTGLTDEDAAPAVEEFAITEPGDIWVLGNHRLVCGDSTVLETVAALFNGVKPGLMVTDPPYGVDYDADWRNDACQAGKGNGAPGGRAIGKVKNDNVADWREAWALFPGDVAYVWHAAVHASVVADSLFATQFVIRSQIIWAKSHLAISRGHYHWQHEPCWYAVRTGGTGHWHGDRKQTTLWQIDKPVKSETGHSTQKPVECMRRPIVNNSSPGQAVYDPFCGSGTTIIAAETEGRICYAIELDPKYVDVAVKRWQDFTGKLATLENNGGCTFEQAQFGRRLRDQDAIKEEVLTWPLGKNNNDGTQGSTSRTDRNPADQGQSGPTTNKPRRAKA